MVYYTRHVRKKLKVNFRLLASADDEVSRMIGDGDASYDTYIDEVDRILASRGDYDMKYDLTFNEMFDNWMGDREEMIESLEYDGEKLRRLHPEVYEVLNEDGITPLDALEETAQLECERKKLSFIFEGVMRNPVFILSMVLEL